MCTFNYAEIHEFRICFLPLHYRVFVGVFLFLCGKRHKSRIADQVGI